MNYIYTAVETQQFCAAISLDPAKAFDTVDHSVCYPDYVVLVCLI